MSKMLSAGLFIRAPHGKQPKHPSIVEWVNRLHCKHKMEYHLSARTMGYNYIRISQTRRGAKEADTNVPAVHLRLCESL